MGANTQLSKAALASLKAISVASKTHGLTFWQSPSGKLVVTLGEVHLKFKKAKLLGKTAVDAFALRGVEGMRHWQPGPSTTLAKCFGFLLVFPQLLIRKLTVNQVKGSTILDAWAATHGQTVALERGFQPGVRTWWALVGLTSFVPVMSLGVWMLIHYRMPFWFEMAVVGYEMYFVVGLIPSLLLRHHSWAALLHPLAGLIYERDRFMARQTVQMLVESPEPAALTVMGRAHLKGYGLALKSHGFTKLEAGDVLPDYIVSTT
jgi:hypothetical protein